MPFVRRRPRIRLGSSTSRASISSTRSCPSSASRSRCRSSSRCSRPQLRSSWMPASRDDIAMRVTGLACFLLTALLLYGLVRHVDWQGQRSRGTRRLRLDAVRSPLESHLDDRVSRDRRRGRLRMGDDRLAREPAPAVGGLALAAGLVGMLVKPTTAVFWLLPALGYRPTGPTPGRRRTARSGSSHCCSSHSQPRCSGHGTRTRSRPPARRPHGSRAASSKTGTSERSPSASTPTSGERSWSGCRTTSSGSPGSPLLVVSVIAAVTSRQRLFWLGIGLAAVLPPLVFTNLYSVHDYYLAAITPAIAALIGLGGRICVATASPAAVRARRCGRRGSASRDERTRCSNGATGRRPTPTIPARANSARAEESTRSHGRTIASESSGSTGPPRFSTTRIAEGSWSSTGPPRPRSTSFTATGTAISSSQIRATTISAPRALAVAGRSRPAHRTAWRTTPPAPGVAIRRDRRRERMPPSGRSLQRGIGLPCGKPATIPSSERGTLIVASAPLRSARDQRVG